MTSKYPSIPTPTNTLDSMYNVMLAMKQVLALLTINVQPPGASELTQSSQIFTTVGTHEILNQTVTVQSADLTALTAAVNLLQSEFTTLNTAFIIDTASRVITQSGASLIINRSLGESCRLTVTSSITSITINNWPPSGTLGRILLFITNGAFTMTGWPAAVKWAAGAHPVITPGGKDLIMLATVDGGVTIFGSVVGQNFL
jgi:hypothetical protein